MRHKNKPKFGAGKDHRRKLLRSLASSIILHEKVETIASNARAVRPYLEKLITRSKTGTLHNRRVLLTKVTKNATAKLLEVIGPKFAAKNGGYLRLTKLAANNAPRTKVLIEFTE